MIRISCPFHDEDTPSAVLYETHLHCFGCGAHVKREELDLNLLPEVGPRPEPENISTTLEYIHRLPRKKIRGLDLPYDEQYFYVVWPNRMFYKKRKLNSSSEPKYIGPKRQKPPLFDIALPGKNLLIVEGELNALSLSTIYPTGYNIVSPGSATQLSKFMPQYLTYDTIFVIVDRDAPGVAYGLELKTKLLQNKKKVQLIAMEVDYNDVLQQRGMEGVEETFKKDVALYGM